LELQGKLLRALQEKEIERLGGNKTIKVDVRIIAATNRDLNKEVKAGKFREDLFYRLHVFPINLPPLRERKEDLPLLATHFLQRYAQKNGKTIHGLSHKALQEMMSYSWPGNIRELEHIIERSVIITNNKLIQELSLPDISKMRTATAASDFVVKSWEEQERDYIMEILKLTNGNVKGKAGAAELLQLPPTTLQSKMKKLGILRKHFIKLAESQE
jgi:formate hydrogenlyase transcriptional activator